MTTVEKSSYTSAFDLGMFLTGPIVSRSQAMLGVARHTSASQLIAALNFGRVPPCAPPARHLPIGVPFPTRCAPAAAPALRTNSSWSSNRSGESFQCES